MTASAGACSVRLVGTDALSLPRVNLLTHALQYAAAGWYVFPVAPRGKRPHGMLGAGGGYHHATTNADTIRAWWGADPSANIGIALAASRLVCLDVDVSGGKPGTASYVALAAEHPEIEACALVAQTGSGGAHLLWRATDDIGATRRHAWRPALDLLSDGYIVAAPSVHESGGVYAWHKLGAPTEAPTVLRAALARRDRAAPVLEVAPQEGSLGKIKPGSRNSDLFRFAARLRNQGLGERAILAACVAENAERFDPPLDDAEVAEVVAKAIRGAPVQRDLLGGESFRDELLAKFSAPASAGGAGITPEIAARLQAIFAPPTPEGEIKALDRSILDTSRVPMPPVSTLPTKYPELNESLGVGLRSGSMVVLAGPPGQGKSAFALDLVMDAILREGGAREAIVFSTELASNQLVARVASHVIGDVSWRDLEAGALSGATITDTLERAGLGRLRTVGSEDMPRQGEHVLRALALAICESVARTGLRPVVVLDYLQHLARGADDNARARVGDISGKLRAITSALDCFTIAVSSVSRAAYSATAKAQAGTITDPAHYLTVIKESGDVEYDAACVLFLEVAPYEEGKAERAARIAVAKARTGPPMFVGATFTGHNGRWAHSTEAAYEMTAEAHAERRTNTAQQASDDSVLERVARLEAAQNFAALSSASAVHAAEGGTRATILASLKRLEAAGKIAKVERRYTDGKGVVNMGAVFTVVCDP